MTLYEVFKILKHSSQGETRNLLFATDALWLVMMYLKILHILIGEKTLKNYSSKTLNN